MKLMYSPASPFVRKVRVLIDEIGWTDRIEMVQASSTPLGTEDADLIAANPTGKIPALVRADGPAIYDSRVICRYLDSVAGGGLYPEGRIWETLTLEATGDALMDAAVLITYDRRFRPADDGQAAWIRGQRLKIDRALDALEARWMSHLFGPLDMGQIAVGCALGYLDFRHGDLDWRKGRPALAAWEEKLRARPSMAATAPADR